MIPLEKNKAGGSPPPMRGKVRFCMMQLTRCGITPAYAGKRVIRSGFHKLFQDHPRLCGEKQFRAFSAFRFKGSPPPMRGKVQQFPDRFRFLGITPAYAGKRSFCRSSVLTSRDHPRLCGEKTKKIPKQRYFFHQPASFSFSLQYT